MAGLETMIGMLSLRNSLEIKGKTRLKRKKADPQILESMEKESEEQQEAEEELCEAVLSETDEDASEQEMPVKAVEGTVFPTDREQLRQAVIWAEMLGEPTARRRRKERRQARGGYQSNVDRR